MLQHRRSVLIFICFIVFFQAIYYIATFQIKKKYIPILTFQEQEPVVNEQSSDIYQTSSHTTVTTAAKIKILSQNLSPFVNLSFELNFTKPDPILSATLPICHFETNKNQSYRIKIEKDIYPFHRIEQTQGTDLQPGGHWFPTDCQPEQRLALIICYRNRENHLKLFLNNIHSFLKQQKLDYTIFIVNQHGQEQFNRAALFNVGFLEAMKLYSFNCFIFHDVDLLPEDLRNLYKCGDRPRHM